MMAEEHERVRALFDKQAPIVGHHRAAASNQCSVQLDSFRGMGDSSAACHTSAEPLEMILSPVGPSW